MKVPAAYQRHPGGEWLPDMDLNHDKQIQSLLCYRYTIGQTIGVKVGFSGLESRMVAEGPGSMPESSEVSGSPAP
jgi:hypothetical protein